MKATKPVKNYTSEDFRQWGAQGSKARKHRVLTREQALAMVEARRLNKAKKQSV